jgi:hypothetical protein
LLLRVAKCKKKTEDPNLCPGRTGGSLQMNRLSFRNNQLKLETSRELPFILEESIEEYTSTEESSKTGRCLTCNRLDLESLGSSLTMPKNFLGTDPNYEVESNIQD